MAVYSHMAEMRGKGNLVTACGVSVPLRDSTCLEVELAAVNASDNGNYT